MQPGEPSVAFDWAGLKDACKSFLDSIIIELCFPRAPYPKRILYHILHDAVDESPREAKRFPQSMWDAVGDLSVSLYLGCCIQRMSQSFYAGFVGTTGSPGEPSFRSSRRETQNSFTSDARAIRKMARCSGLLKTSIRIIRQLQGPHQSFGKNQGSFRT